MISPEFLTLAAEILGLLLVLATIKKELLQLKLLQKQSLAASRKVESYIYRDGTERTRADD